MQYVRVIQSHSSCLQLRKPDYPSEHFLNQYFVSFNNDPIFDVLQKYVRLAAFTLQRADFRLFSYMYMYMCIFFRDTDEKYAEEVSEKRLLQENENETDASPSRWEYQIHVHDMYTQLNVLHTCMCMCYTWIELSFTYM